jgi:hypothetical protein
LIDCSTQLEPTRLINTVKANSKRLKMSEDTETPDVTMTPVDETGAPPSLDNTETATDTPGAEAGEDGGEPKPISKSQLKKLAKGKTKEKKEKPQWGDGSKKKDKAAKKAEAVPPKPVFVNETPKGQKKVLGPMAEAYHPAAVEASWQDWWEASGYYKGDATEALAKSKEDKFVMVIPPPNVTGSLHLGHALTAAVEDTLTRWHRMKGHATLYVPGAYRLFLFLALLKLLGTATRTHPNHSPSLLSQVPIMPVSPHNRWWKK